MAMLFLAALSFIGSHFLLSHPLRAPLVRAVGAGPFQGLYSVVALATLGWTIVAFRAAPAGDYAWPPSEADWAIATALMLAAAILLVGSLVRNPALPAPGAEALARAEPRGVFRLTRHPMMWSFALWGLSHILIAPRPPVFVLSGAIIVLALVGAALQDAKKRVLMGDSWSQWQSRTSFLPFARGIAWPGTGAMLGGTLLWLAATWAHMPAGAGPAGLWRWIG